MESSAELKLAALPNTAAAISLSVKSAARPSTVRAARKQEQFPQPGRAADGFVLNNAPHQSPAWIILAAIALRRCFRVTQPLIFWRLQACADPAPTPAD